MQTPSRVETLAAGLGIAGAVALAAGPLAIQLGAVVAFVGFRIFGLGLLLGLLALVVGAFGLWRTRAAAGRPGRERAAVGAGLGLAILAIVIVGAGSGLRAPPINDITTDLDDPPVFVVAREFEVNKGRDLSHAGEELAAQQREGYPDLAPIGVGAPPDAAFARALEVAEELGWEITSREPSTGVFEAVSVTRAFRFVDDIAVRVRRAAGGSVIDVRSKSRDGRGDLGANAARIRAFRDTVTR